MKTSQYFLEDQPIQILFLDTDQNDARKFFENGLGGTWFDYELHFIGGVEDAIPFLDAIEPHKRPIDLLLISNRCWYSEGAQLVLKIRTQKSLENLPIYCVTSCLKKSNDPASDCWNIQWRLKTDCDGDAHLAATPYTPNLLEDNSLHINGVICPNNLDKEISKIVDDMTSNWLCRG